MSRRKIESEHQVEKVGKELRAMMSWNREIEVT
jgi:ketol-acid reductoisomerase